MVLGSFSVTTPDVPPLRRLSQNPLCCAESCWAPVGLPRWVTSQLCCHLSLSRGSRGAPGLEAVSSGGESKRAEAPRGAGLPALTRRLTAVAVTAKESSQLHSPGGVQPVPCPEPVLRDAVVVVRTGARLEF